MIDCEKLVAHDISSDSIRLTSGTLAPQSRCSDSSSAKLVSRGLIVFGVMVMVALTTVCMAQCVRLRQENAEIRLQVDRLQARVDQQFGDRVSCLLSWLYHSGKNRYRQHFRTLFTPQHEHVVRWCLIARRGGRVVSVSVSGSADRTFKSRLCHLFDAW